MSSGSANDVRRGTLRRRESSLKWFAGFLFLCLTSHLVLGQGAVKLPEEEQKQKEEKLVSKEQEQIAQQANLEIRGNTAFDDKTLRSQLKEQLTFIAQNGLTNARADDAAFFLGLFYKKHGYAKVDVRYTIVSGSHFRLDISEGPLVHLGKIQFIGNRQLPTDKLFQYAVGPTQSRYSKATKLLPFVSSDLVEGAALVERYYVSQGFVEAMVEPPTYRYVQADLVDVQIVIHEGRSTFSARSFLSGRRSTAGKLCAGRFLICSGFPTPRGGWLISHGGSRLTTRPAVILRSRSTPSGSRLWRSTDMSRCGLRSIQASLSLRRRDGERNAAIAPELSGQSA